MKKIFILLALSLGAMSCGDELNLDPQQDLSDDAALSNDANIKKALYGAYDALSSTSLIGGDMQLYSELLGADGEINWVGTFNEPREIFGKKILTNNGFVSDTWIQGYKTIYVCNNILQAIDKVNPEDQDLVKGEALFIRGLVYFEMVELFAKPFNAGASNPGVPLILIPSNDLSEAKVARATVGAVYSQILTDLNDAENLLPDENDVFASKTAAAAILSRVYLQQEDYANARDAANRAIDYGTNSLTDTYAEAFNNPENSSEDIFAIQISDQDGGNSMQTYWSVPDFGGRDGDVEVADKHIDLYEAGDDRLNMFYFGNGARRNGKWKTLYTNIPVVRLAEMYLTRAEANFRLGTDIGDDYVNDINLIRSRVGLDDLVGPLTLDEIVLERKLELAHEGQTIHDIKRLKLGVDSYAFDADKLVFPIPIREINVNNNLQQNPGYVN